jgi:muconolactone delta-isomerase
MGVKALRAIRQAEVGALQTMNPPPKSGHVRCTSACLRWANNSLVNNAQPSHAFVQNKSFWRLSAQSVRVPMKYMLTWTERPQGSPMEYENAQKRILEVFTQWKAPGNFKIELFVIRVGDWGGYMLLDCDDPTAVHKFCSMLPAFVFEARPVIPIDDAVRVELESIAFRDGLKRK